MLYCYPLDAIADNWVHISLVQIVRSIHEAVEAGHASPTWPELIPDEFRDRLRSRRKLRDKLLSYAKALTALDQNDRAKVIEALDAQNNVAALLSRDADCSDVKALPATMRGEIREVFEVGFELLTDLFTRDAHYVKVYNEIPSRICPFCGSEFFDAPGRLREALDHYLAESLYPFAGANLRNLVPMGVKCNSGYKKAKDILHKETGERRRAIDPYAGEPLTISLRGSLPLGVAGDNKPFWNISIIGDAEHAETWNAVFKIKERFEKDVLGPELRAWLNSFASWCRSANVEVMTDAGLTETLRLYRDHLRRCGLDDRCFLRVEVFEILLADCENGLGRTITIMRSLANLHVKT